MKTRKILAASTAALLSFASVAVVASAATAFDEEPGAFVELEGSNVSFKVDAKAAEKLNKYTIDATKLADAKVKAAFTLTAETDTDAGDGKIVVNDDKDVDDNIFAGLSKTLRKNLAKAVGTEDGAGAELGCGLEVYDISIGYADSEDYVADEDITLNAPVTIRIEASAVKGTVYHVDGDKLVDVGAKRTVKHETGEDDVYAYEFTTKSFSPFIVIENAVAGAVKADADGAATSDPAADDGSSAADGATSPDTGIALAIAPVVLAAGAVAVVALKKKH